ncbi:MAG: hydroxylamine reductase [Planctomycetaceae bacterium]|nr:hydroxylamine reductase [Planctomycetaceae bacterium]
MLCYQCEQAVEGTGCTHRGVCGKMPDNSDMQDLAVQAALAVAVYADRLASAGVVDRDAGRYCVEALFTTVTNVNFDAETVRRWVVRGMAERDRLAALLRDRTGADPTDLPEAASFTLASNPAEIAVQAEKYGISGRQRRLGEDKAGVLYLILYGVKGASAYIDHAHRLGREEDGIYALLFSILATAATLPDDMSVLLGEALRAGKLNLEAMRLLDAANTETYGHPEPTEVRITPKRGKCILVSGHDLADLHDILVLTEGTGINVYTHGELLPANAYPGLKKFPHLAGNYGGAWQEQDMEFADFPGPILLTTNCLVPPKDSYISRVYTTGLVAYPGVTHLPNGRFEPLVDAALAAPGFTEDGEDRRITIGFARNTVVGAAGAILDAVKAGQIRRFYLIGGCDGAKPGRNYYTEFAEKLPDDTIILTLACGKYRFNKLPLGTVAGFPRVLDMGQCNDAYSAVQVALALAEALGCGVNDLPLSLILSWYEQKAVAVLLTLLHLGIKNIYLGPTLPLFVTPPVLATLVEAFDIKPISSAEADIAATLGA